MYDQKIPKPNTDREVSLDEWDDLVADRYQVPKNLFRAMTKQESGGDPNAVSPTGVRGRQQVTERVAKGYGLDRNDPYQQSVAAARYLRDQYDSLKDIKDDNERWLGGLAKYYGGGNAVDARSGTLSGSSVDGLSNPGEHVERVAKKWGELNRGGGQVAAPTPAPSRTLTPKRTTRTLPQPSTAPQDNPFSLSAPTGFMTAEQGARSRTLSPEAQAEANLRNAEAARYELRSAPGKASEMVKAGAMRGAQALGNMMRAAGTVTTGQTGGKPALSPETEANLQRREAAQDVITPNTAPVVRGVTSGAIQAAPALASAGAGAAAPLIMGAATQAANEDWRNQPGRALARTVAGAVVPAAAGRAVTALARPATRAAQIATGAAGGAAGNVATAAGDQAIFEGRLDPQTLAQQAVIGAGLGAATPPPRYRPRQPRGGAQTADEVFRYDAEGNEINPQLSPVPESDATARVPAKPFDPSIAAPEETLSPADIRAKFNRQGRRVLQEKIAATEPQRQTRPLRRTQGIERSEPVASPDAPTEQLTAGATSRLPQVEAAPEAPAAPRANAIRDAFRAEADAAKIEAAQLEQAGRFEEAAIKYDAAHRALTRLRRSIGNPKNEVEAGLLGQIDTEVTAAAQNRANARKGKGKGRVTAPEEVAADTAPTKGITERDLAPQRVMTETPEIAPLTPEVQPAQQPRADDRPARPTRRYSANEQARSELSPSEQLLLDRADQRPSPVAGRGLVSFSPFNDLVTNNKQVVDRLYGMDLTSPEAKPLLDQLDAYAQRRRMDPEHVENLKNYIRNDQLENAGLERRGVDPEQARTAEPTANLRRFYSEKDTLPPEASGRLSGRLPEPSRPKPAPELPYKGGSAPLDTAMPEQVPQMSGLSDEARARVARMSPQEVDAALVEAETVRNEDFRRANLSESDRALNREMFTAANERRKELVKQKLLPPKHPKQLSREQVEANQWANDPDLGAEAQAYKDEHGRFPKDLAELRRGRPRTEALPKGAAPTIQHERFGEVKVVEKASSGKLVVEDANGQTHTIKNPRTAGNRSAAYARKVNTEELSIPVAEQMGKLSESAVEPNFVTEARTRLKQASTGQIAGSGSRALFDQAIVTGYQAYKAGMQFRDWSKEVIAKAGAAVEPHLRRAWSEIQKFHRDEGGSAKVGPGPSAPQSPTAKATRDLSSIKLDTVGSGRLPRAKPRKETAAPAEEQLRRAGLKDITLDSLRAKEAERGPAESQEAAKPDGFFKSLSAYRKASMLTKPVTHITNMISNAGFQASEEVARIPAGIADMAISAVTGRRSIAGMNPKAFARSTYEAATEGVKEAKQVLKTGRSNYEITQNIELEELASKSKILNTYVNTVFRALKAEDQIFKTYAMRRSLESQARVMALNDVRQGNISRSRVKEQTKQYIDNPTSEMSTQAILDAEVATFQNDNKISSALSSARAEFGDAGNFAIDMVLPFTKTPTNIIARTLEMTPLGFGKNAMQVAKAITSKSFSEADQRAFATTFGRASVGSGLVLLGYGLAAKGMMTGLPDTDWRKRAQDESKAPHAAILDPLTDRWFSLTRLSPVGTLLAIGATLHRDMHEKLPEGKSRAGNVVGGVGQVVLDQPLLKAGKEVFDMVNEPDRTPVKAGRMAASFIPAVVDDVGNLTDKVQRKPKTFGQAIKGRVPGLRQSLEPKTNAAGQPIKTEFTDVIDPFRSRSRSQTGTDLERRMIDLNVGGLSPKQKPGEPEDVYRERVEKSRGWFQEYGAKLVSDPSFNSLTPDQQEKAIENLRQRIGAQANLTRASERGFAPSQIIRSVREGERSRARNRGKFIWTPPEE